MPVVDRHTLGLGALLSLAEAAAALPMHDSAAREWLAARGLVSDLEGRKVVVWSAVLDELRKAPAEAPRTLVNLPRVSIPPRPQD